jgi:hypothetical protein
MFYGIGLRIKPNLTEEDLGRSESEDNLFFVVKALTS